MTSIAALAETARLIGEPARAAMLVALIDGRALTAGELARAASITPQTASGHLARLGTGGMNHWPFIYAAYGIGLVGTIVLTAWSWLAMRRAEAEADKLSRDR